MNTEKKASKEVSKKSLPTKDYTLKTAVSIDGKLKKAGEKVKLTEKGAIYFKRKHRI